LLKDGSKWLDFAIRTSSSELPHADPPDLQEEAVTSVLAQWELLCAGSV
jgi:hypothetical protein